MITNIFEFAASQVKEYQVGEISIDIGKDNQILLTYIGSDQLGWCTQLSVNGLEMFARVDKQTLSELVYLFREGRSLADNNNKRSLSRLLNDQLFPYLATVFDFTIYGE